MTQYTTGTAFVTGLRDHDGWHCTITGCPVRFKTADDGTGPDAEEVERHVREHGAVTYPKLTEKKEGAGV